MSAVEVEFLTESHKVISSVFATGAGRIGEYDSCCWQVVGQGQFRPLAGANPAIGEKHELTYVDELKIEMVCEEQSIKPAVLAMKSAHPYEEPAYQVWPVMTIEDLGE